MKSKREALESIERQYSNYMMVWTVNNLCGYITTELIPFSSAKEEHHIIANAANKFYELVAINDSETNCFYESTGEIS